ncbi:exosortase K [Cellulosilyticum sp. I15G10I2]|uniref:exosortase K n=1 Tax=Cellulosilyticum sp. I15G10I2 TaxID=1892843 RepID=UPI00085C7474|nr:exosortase K [Cellulosilyticum sp. I15G10I2]
MRRLSYRINKRSCWYAYIAAALLILYGFYQYGSLEHLMIILKPVTFIVEKALGISFAYITDIGFVSEQVNVVINKNCSGVMFWMIVFLMLGFSFIPRDHGSLKLFISFISLLLFSYGITIAANASRIIIAINVLAFNEGQTVAAGRLLHQSIGILVYCTYLWMIYVIFLNLTKKEVDDEKAI